MPSTCAIFKVSCCKSVIYHGQEQYLRDGWLCVLVPSSINARSFYRHSLSTKSMIAITARPHPSHKTCLDFCLEVQRQKNWPTDKLLQWNWKANQKLLVSVNPNLWICCDLLMVFMSISCLFPWRCPPMRTSCCSLWWDTAPVVTKERCEKLWAWIRTN